MQRVFDFLRTDDLPPIARRNYRYELPQIALWGTLAGVMEGAIAGVVAARTFHASAGVTTLIWALPVVASLLNPVWSALLRGRRRIPTLTFLTTAGGLIIATVALVPRQSPFAAWLFAAQVGCTHAFLTAIVTLRASMWRSNYGSTYRARVAGRLQTVRLFTGLLAGALLAAVFDWAPWAYAFAYPGLAMAGLTSLIPARRIRVRGEPSELRRIHAHLAAQRDEDGAVRGRLWSGLRESVQILRTDRLFARYMLSQFLIGAANFFTEPLLLVALTQRYDFRYFETTALMTLIPSIAVLATLRYWAPYFDRVGVLRFRVLNSLAWLASYLVLGVAMWVLAFGGAALLPWVLPLLILARVCNGFGRAGGAIAWNIGHLHFAPEHQTELYMGIHVGLTGLRALVMPFLAWLCQLWIGDAAFVVGIALALVAHELFRRLDREDRERATGVA